MEEETEEEFSARAGKAARMALIATGGLVGFFCVLGGAVWAAVKVAGLFGLLTVAAAFVFVTLWFTAMLDLRDQRHPRP